MVQAEPNANNSRQSGEGQGSPERPVWNKRVWTGSGNLEVAVWARMVGKEGEEREVMNTTLRKTYKDGTEYKESRSLRAEELPLASLLLQEAFTFITNEQNRE